MIDLDVQEDSEKLTKRCEIDLDTACAMLDEDLSHFDSDPAFQALCRYENAVHAASVAMHVNDALVGHEHMWAYWTIGKLARATEAHARQKIKMFLTGPHSARELG